MFDGRTGADPYVFYKMHHVWRAEKAWILSDDLGLYEALREGPASIEDVCKRTGLQSRPVSVLLAANACMGIVEAKDGQYSLHEIQRQFVLEGGRARKQPRIPEQKDDPDYHLWKQAILSNQPVAEDLPPWIRNPKGSPETTAFAPDRHGWRIIWGEALARAFDFGRFSHVVDLGGATGGVLVGLAGRYSNLRGTVVDLPYSKRSAEAAIQGCGASDRVCYFAADFFVDSYPEDADVFFMSHIIHDWDDQHCLTLLRRCHEALPSGCPVIVQEFLLNKDKTGPLLAVFQWFGLLRGTLGDQRTAEEIEALMEKAGFGDMESLPIDSEQSIVVGWKR